MWIVTEGDLTRGVCENQSLIKLKGFHAGIAGKNVHLENQNLPENRQKS